MFFPPLKKYNEKSALLSRFSSLVTKGRVPDGCFQGMSDFQGDMYPFAAVREKRGIYSSADPLFPDGEKITAVLDTPSGLLICTENEIYLGAVKLSVSLDPSYKSRTAVPFGRNIFIIPDGIYIECTDDGVSVSDCRFDFTGDNCDAGFAMADGTDIFPSYFGDFPAAAAVGEYAVIGYEGKNECWQYTGEKWKYMYDVYMKIVFPHSIQGFSQGMELHIESDGSVFDNGYARVISHTANTLVLACQLRAPGQCTFVRLSKSVPLMDFAVEHNNRIYGCRYGKNNEGNFVNEIYASKLGDPREWYSLEGISTDSYTVSLGCSGRFTGAGKLGGEVLFFKEDCTVRLLGSRPADFTVYTASVPGPQAGFHRTLCNLGGTLFYKSREGITVYDGAGYELISPALDLSGLTDGVAGGYDGKYRIAFTRDGSGEVYSYDTQKGLWHRETDLFITEHMFTRGGNLFHLCFDGNGSGYHIYTPRYSLITDENRAIPIVGETAFTPEEEKKFSFYAETGRLFEELLSCNKKIRCIRISMKLFPDSHIRAFIRTDADDSFREIFFLDKATDGIFSVPVAVPPCRYFALRFEGEGQAVLSGIQCVIHTNTEVKGIE